MSKLLWNPTNEDLKSPLFGESPIFSSPGKRRRSRTTAGKHLLHNLGVRGLTVLEFDGCDEVMRRKWKDALDRNKDFQDAKQVIEYNQRNETRKQTNMAYLAPTKEVKEYAIELGLGLLEPFTVKDVEREATARLADENKELREMLTKTMGRMNEQSEQIAALTQLVAPPEFGGARPQMDSNQKVPKQGGPKWEAIRMLTHVSAGPPSA